MTKGMSDMSDMSDTIKQVLGASDTIKQVLGDLRNLSGEKKSDVFWTPPETENFGHFGTLKMELLKGKCPSNESKITKISASGGIQK